MLITATVIEACENTILHDTKAEAQKSVCLAERWVRYSRHTFPKRLAAAPIVVSEGLRQSPCSSDHPACCLTALKWAHSDACAGTIDNTDSVRRDSQCRIPMHTRTRVRMTWRVRVRVKRGLFRYFPSDIWNVHTGLNSSSNNEVSCICLSSDASLSTEGAHLSSYWNIQRPRRVFGHFSDFVARCLNVIALDHKFL